MWLVVLAALGGVDAGVWFSSMGAAFLLGVLLDVVGVGVHGSAGSWTGTLGVGRTSGAWHGKHEPYW